MNVHSLNSISKRNEKVKWTLSVIMRDRSSVIKCEDRGVENSNKRDEIYNNNVTI